MRTSLASSIFTSLVLISPITMGCHMAPGGGIAKDVAKSMNADLVQEIIDARREFDEAMISAVDVRTAMAAKTKMEEAWKTMRTAIKELEKTNKLALGTGAMDEADFQEFDRKIRDEQHASAERTKGHRERIMDDPALRLILKPLFDRIDRIDSSPNQL